MIRTHLAGALALALSLCACSTTGTGTHVATASTVSDISYEAIGSADLAYEAANRAGVALVQVGRIDSATFHRLDNQAYAALLALRSVAAGVRAGTAGQSDLTVAQTALLAAAAALTSLEK